MNLKNGFDNLIRRSGAVVKRSRLFKRWQNQHMPSDAAGIQSFVSVNQQSRIAYPLVMLVVLPILWFLSTQISSYFMRSNIYSDEGFFNLTKAGVTWDVYYGESPLCGDIECHLTPEWPEESFTKKMVLPAREFPLKDFRQGQKIYLRTRFQIPEPLLASNQAIVFHSLYIWAQNYRFYFNGQLMDQGSSELLNIALPKPLIPEDGNVRIAVMIDPGGLPYQGLANRRDLLIGSKSELKKTAYDAESLKTTFYLWFLLPKLTFCLIFSLIYIFMSQTRALMTFISFTFLSSLDIYLHSGYAETMLPAGINWTFYGMIARNLGNLAVLAFINEFFRRRSRYFYRWIGILAAVFVLFPATIPYLGYKKAFNLLEIFHSVLHPFAFMFGVYVSFMTAAFLSSTKTSLRRARVSLFLAAFFAVCSVTALTSTWQVITDLLNLNLHLGVNLNWALDLLLFVVLTSLTVMDIGYALTAKQQMEQELRDIEERMDLAKSVQEMLLPAERQGEFGVFKFGFHYEPADKMSGDWMNIWDTESGEKRLIMGDVVGKGPQAALAASAVACVISECRFENTTLEECIIRINMRLLDLFKGKINTTLMAMRLTADGESELYNCGAIGWVVKGKDRTSYIPIVGDQLGAKEKIRMGRKVVRMEPGMTAIAFTDGCLEGARALKALVRNLQEIPDDAAFEILKDTVVQTGSQYVRPDDKTILMVRAG